MSHFRTGDGPGAAAPPAPPEATGQRTVHRVDVHLNADRPSIPCSPEDVVLVGSRVHAVVEVWFIRRPETSDRLLTEVLVTGTGQPVPEGAFHLGSVIDPGTGTGPGHVRPGALVWHLWGLPPQERVVYVAGLAPSATSTEEGA